ncbi:PREDICTED: uncharacterized protein LOC109465481 [Branchiostoma belcheri]|uniref:Uncharacterized protein LOC109465481 n=1 Tax=Branchiostoma belcheri TaxID=7741 RepID=A0A6P4YHU8_BRABE|nr:PREDICTED: uncharacterized protein LOC109465481 [Branchiostoma belcheri]
MAEAIGDANASEVDDVEQETPRRETDQIGSNTNHVRKKHVRIVLPTEVDDPDLRNTVEQDKDHAVEKDTSPRRKGKKHLRPLQNYLRSSRDRWLKLLPAIPEISSTKEPPESYEEVTKAIKTALQKCDGLIIRVPYLATDVSYLQTVEESLLSLKDASNVGILADFKTLQKLVTMKRSKQQYEKEGDVLVEFEAMSNSAMQQLEKVLRILKDEVLFFLRTFCTGEREQEKCQETLEKNVDGIQGLLNSRMSEVDPNVFSYGQLSCQVAIDVVNWKNFPVLRVIPDIVDRCYDAIRQANTWLTHDSEYVSRLNRRTEESRRTVSDIRTRIIITNLQRNVLENSSRNVNREIRQRSRRLHQVQREVKQLEDEKASRETQLGDTKPSTNLTKTHSVTSNPGNVTSKWRIEEELRNLNMELSKRKIRLQDAEFSLEEYLVSHGQDQAYLQSQLRKNDEKSDALRKELAEAFEKLASWESLLQEKTGRRKIAEKFWAATDKTSGRESYEELENVLEILQEELGPKWRRFVRHLPGPRQVIDVDIESIKSAHPLYREDQIYHALALWRKRNPQHANVDSILTALEKCGLLGIREKALRVLGRRPYATV